MTILKNVRLNGTVNLIPGYVSNGLYVYWDIGLKTSYPGSGTSVTNLISATNPHTFNTATTYTTLSGIPCVDSTSMTAPGIKPVTYQQAYSLLPSTYTYCVWARIQASDAVNYRTLIRSVPNDHLLLVNTSNVLGYYDNDTANFYSTGYTVTSFVNVWAQWTVTSSGTGNSTYYINGTQVGSSVTFGGGGNYHDTVGGLGSGQGFGYLSHCLLYNRVLSLAEITQNYQTFRGRFGV